MSRPEDAYRSAMNRITASDDWKARTRAAMDATAETPRLRVAKNPRRVWKGVLAAAACLVLVGIPALRLLPSAMSGGVGAGAPNLAAYDAADGESAAAAAPRLYSAAAPEETGEQQPAPQNALAGSSAAENPPQALEGLPAEGLPADGVLVQVGEDEASVYYLAGGLEGVTVLYADGSAEPLADALAAGRVTLADLRRLGAPLTAEPKAG